MEEIDGKIVFTPEELEVTPYDTAECLDSEEVISEYLALSLEDPDPDVFLQALGHVLRARGMAEVAKKTGLAREALYRTCQPGKNPRFSTIMKITRAIGVPLGFPEPSSRKKRTKRAKAAVQSAL